MAPDYYKLISIDELNARFNKPCEMELVQDTKWTIIH